MVGGGVDFEGLVIHQLLPLEFLNAECTSNPF